MSLSRSLITRILYHRRICTRNGYFGKQFAERSHRACLSTARGPPTPDKATPPLEHSRRSYLFPLPSLVPIRSHLLLLPSTIFFKIFLSVPKASQPSFFPLRSRS